VPEPLPNFSSTRFAPAAGASPPDALVTTEVVKPENDVPDKLEVTPLNEYVTSLVYFTGSQQFNIKMRARALELGYTLNEHSLSPVKDKVPKVLFFETEKSLFDFLKMEYIDPEYR
jgi:DNA polymerase beta